MTNIGAQTIDSIINNCVFFSSLEPAIPRTGARPGGSAKSDEQREVDALDRSGASRQ